MPRNVSTTNYSLLSLCVKETIIVLALLYIKFALQLQKIIFVVHNGYLYYT
jgi:hypothetical protein